MKRLSVLIMLVVSLSAPTHGRSLTLEEPEQPKVNPHKPLIFTVQRGPHTATLEFHYTTVKHSDYRWTKTGPFITHMNDKYMHGFDTGALTDDMSGLEIFESIRITLGGKTIDLPTTFFQHYIRPPHTRSRLNASISEDGQAVYIFLQGSNAAGTYDSIWVIHRNGTMTDFTYSSDMSLFRDYGAFNDEINKWPEDYLVDLPTRKQPDSSSAPEETTE